MNFLAHALLAGSSPADRLGGLMGDFVKGPLPAGLPGAIAEGVRLHRLVDAWADTHPSFRASRYRMSAARRRYAGVLVDLFYDHLLAAHWHEYHEAPLERFAAAAYVLLAQNEALLPPALAALVPRMRERDWLTSYREWESIDRAIDRTAQRLSRPNTMAGGAHELRAAYAHFEADFRDFMPDALRFAAGVVASR